jgi:hypothetical protein
MVVCASSVIEEVCFEKHNQGNFFGSASHLPPAKRIISVQEEGGEERGKEAGAIADWLSVRPCAHPPVIGWWLEWSIDNPTLQIFGH